MPSDNPKKHIRLNGHTESHDYKYPKTVIGSFDVKERNRNIHGNNILRQLEQIKNQFNILEDVTLPQGIVRDDAIYVEFTSEWGYPLKFESLEQDRETPDFQILNIHEETSGEDRRYTVTLMMTQGGVGKFINKVKEYLSKNIFKKDTETGSKIDTGNPKNNLLLNNIQNIQLATLQSFWSDSPEFSFPQQDEVVWWEVWFRRTTNDEEKINRVAQNLKVVGVESGSSELIFAEHRVRLIKGTAMQLSSSLLLLDNLAELRKPQETADFISHRDITDEGKKEWLDDLIKRTEGKFDENSVIVCLLDSGVNNQHPLIAPFLPNERLYSFDPSAWGMTDDCPGGGHGTGVAGLALYGDLTDAMASSHNIQILHGLESFKIIQNNNSNKPELYGAITENASSAPFIDNPNPRVFCMTVTDKNFAFKGRPSAWSAAVDKIAFGSVLDPVEPQLFIVSGGNVEFNKHSEYPSKNYIDSIHDPGQAYNALTIGTYTRKDKIPAETGYSCLALNGAMAPSNSTSILWDHQWPIKPDFVMEGGNLSTDGVDLSDHQSLKLLTTDKEYPKFLFQPFGDSSAAAALASKMAAELKTSYPDYWPETIRALMVHSADWTPQMLDGLDPNNLKEKECIQLLRSVGYGVPIKEKALNSAINSLTLIAERKIQPYRLEGSTSKYNQYHLFSLPWPIDVLRDSLAEQDVTLKITLSYFIEPNPGTKRYANNFQYHSHALEFAVIKPREDLNVFKRRISAAANLPDEEKNGTGEEWVIGRARSRGSLKKDFITMSGADMADRYIIAVYPKGGWYRTRKKLGKISANVRYSLIVSIETPNVEVDIYNPVLNLITLATEV